MSGVAGERGRGQRAGIGRPQIVAAARDVEPEKLTMQAVADRLGVRRSALNYHVSDREELLRLVAIDAFEANLRADLGTHADWRAVVRSQAVAIRDAVLATGAFVDYFDYDAGSGPVALAAFEDFLVRMTAAGFDTVTAGRTLELLADYAMAFAKDVIMAGDAVHPQVGQLRDALDASASDHYPMVREYLTAPGVAPDDARQFEFALDLIVDGLERRRHR